MRTLPASELGLPRFAFERAAQAEVFDLESHARAREALDFGLSVAGIGFNIFVIGEDRVGRMTATLAYLDHSRYALWLGEPQLLLLDVLKRQSDEPALAPAG